MGCTGRVPHLAQHSCVFEDELISGDEHLQMEAAVVNFLHSGNSDNVKLSKVWAGCWLRAQRFFLALANRTLAAP